MAQQVDEARFNAALAGIVNFLKRTGQVPATISHSEAQARLTNEPDSLQVSFRSPEAYTATWTCTASWVNEGVPVSGGVTFAPEMLEDTND